MLKWKFDAELTTATKILLAAYLNTMHSKTITVVFTYENNIYYRDLNTVEIAELARVTGEKLMTQSLSKGRINKYLVGAVKFATTDDMNMIKAEFPRYAKNSGYIAEFVYRYKVNNETIEQIRKSNKSVPYDEGSDTIDGKQIKEITKGASFTTFEYLLEVAEKKQLANIAEIRNAIAILKEIYNK